MSRTSRNTQMFALREVPDTLQIRGCEYSLVRAFKHDFWAATCLYETTAKAELAKVVVKFGRAQPFCGFDLKFCGRLLRDHEESIYKVLVGIEGVPRYVGRIGETGLAVEYIHAAPLDHLQTPPPGFFDRLKTIFDAIHQRGVAYCDANKRSNILVTEDGKPFLIDYQISLRAREDWFWPFRNIVRSAVDYLSTKDLYHLYKHKRRLAPEELTPEQETLSRTREGLHWIHRKLTKPYRTFRRKFLQKQYAKGALRSPTADIEDHHQPEKQTWRKET